MKYLSQSGIKLKSFSFEERLNNVDELKTSNIVLEDINLFIGNNAHGKTRIFRTLNFIKSLLTNTLLANKTKQINTFFSAKFNFETLDCLGLPCLIQYSIKISPGESGNQYVEEISSNDKLLLATGERKHLLDEETNEPIDNFFVPQNILAISAIHEPQFKTIKLIREFFLRMMFIDSAKTMEVINEPGAFALNSVGTNLASVLNNWSKKYPDLYEEVKEDFIRCFSFIKNIKFVKLPVGQFGVIDLLAINEAGITKDIDQLQWSDGLWRLLCLICLPKTQFEFDGVLYPPSLIWIDEIENGLDFNTLEFITNYLKVYSDNLQVNMSSHSPLMGQFIHPKNWQIVKRKGAKIKVTRPLDVEPKLDEQLNLYRQEYWDFYAKYVSASDLYEPE